MSIKDHYKQERDELQMFLGEMGDLLAQPSGFVQRASKFGGNELVQTLTLGCLENGMSSLESFCQVAKDIGIKITASGLHQRLNTEAVELLRQVCETWMQQKVKTATCNQVLQAFEAVRIIDSSRITLSHQLKAVFAGSRQEASMKVQLSYEYHRGQIEALEVEEERRPDQKCALPQELSRQGDLVIFDLGYFDQNRFAELDEMGVFFISRLQSQTGLFEKDNPQQKVDLLDRLKHLPDSLTYGECVLRLGTKQKLPVRVIYYRAPPEIAQQRRRKAKHAIGRRKRTCSKHWLDWQDWFIFISNVPVHLIDTTQVATVYRLRWQIEVLFKVWKQEMDWGTMRNWRLERLLCQFYARCLALLLFHRLVSTYQMNLHGELSLQKALQRLKRKVATLIDIVRCQFHGLLSFLKRLDSDFRQFATKTKRQKSLSTYDLLKLVAA